MAKFRGINACNSHYWFLYSFTLYKLTLYYFLAKNEYWKLTLAGVLLTTIAKGSSQYFLYWRVAVVCHGSDNRTVVVGSNLESLFQGWLCFVTWQFTCAYCEHSGRAQLRLSLPVHFKILYVKLNQYMWPLFCYVIFYYNKKVALM